MASKWAFKNINNINESNISLVSSTHVIWVACKNSEDQFLDNLNTFWKLDGIGIKDNEKKSVWKFWIQHKIRKSN